MGSAGEQLDSFVARYLPEIAAQAREAIAFFRERHPSANILVYDNYNALAVGFASNEKRGGIIFSVTLYPRWVSLFFGRGTSLNDPDGMLEGSGSSIRHIKLRDGVAYDDPRILKLLDQAIAMAEPPLPESGQGELIIQSISGKQRPRRP